MGIIFETMGTVELSGRRTDYKTLADMSNGRARFFNALTQIIAQQYSLPSGMLTKVQDDTYYVKEEEFCHLVEAVFMSPAELIYEWAQLAAGMYEIIKGQRYQWGWNPYELPWRLFYTQEFVGDSPPKKSTEQWIGQAVPEKSPANFQICYRNKVIALMSNRTAYLFLNMAQAAARFYELPSGVNEIGDTQTVLEGESFCQLVEKAFIRSDYWLYAWSRYAAGMYDEIKCQRHSWAWNPSSLPILVSDAVYCGVEPPRERAPRS